MSTKTRKRVNRAMKQRRENWIAQGKNYEHNAMIRRIAIQQGLSVNDPAVRRLLK